MRIILSSIFLSVLLGTATATSEDHPGQEEQASSNLRALSDVTAKIVGGKPSDPGEFPYYVDLHGCGGSLIAPDVVLTAAHCGNLIGRSVLVGALRQGKATHGAVWRNVVTYVADPTYDDYTLANDFALLQLDSPVVLSTPIELEINDQYAVPADGEDLTVLGLGLTKWNGNKLSNKLRDVEVQAIDTDTCNEPSSYGGIVEDDTMFCAGVDGGGKDSCSGDSGGPIVKIVGQTHIQVGVVSWGEGCAWADYPGVYARVSKAYSWIKATVCDDWGSFATFCDGSAPTPTAPGPTPTSAPGACEDDATFCFKGKCKKDCDWIGKKVKRRNKLCKKKVVKDACPVTCDNCP